MCVSCYTHMHSKLDTTGSCTRHKSWGLLAFGRGKKVDNVVVQDFNSVKVQSQQEKQNISTQYHTLEIFISNICLVGASSYHFWVNTLQETKTGKIYPLIKRIHFVSKFLTCLQKSISINVKEHGIEVICL